MSRINRWLEWQPQAPDLFENALESTDKTDKTGFVGFVGAVPARSQKIEELGPITPELVTLKGGLVAPLPAVQLALDLERRRFRQRVDDEGTYHVEPAAALTDTDRAGLARWRIHLAALVTYECPDGELPQ